MSIIRIPANDDAVCFNHSSPNTQTCQQAINKHAASNQERKPWQPLMENVFKRALFVYPWYPRLRPLYIYARQSKKIARDAGLLEPRSSAGLISENWVTNRKSAAHDAIQKRGPPEPAHNSEPRARHTTCQPSTIADWSIFLPLNV